MRIIGHVGNIWYHYWLFYSSDIEKSHICVFVTPRKAMSDHACDVAIGQQLNCYTSLSSVLWSRTLWVHFKVQRNFSDYCFSSNTSTKYKSKWLINIRMGDQYYELIQSYILQYKIFFLVGKHVLEKGQYLEVFRSVCSFWISFICYRSLGLIFVIKHF